MPVPLGRKTVVQALLLKCQGSRETGTAFKKPTQSKLSIDIDNALRHQFKPKHIITSSLASHCMYTETPTASKPFLFQSVLQVRSNFACPPGASPIRHLRHLLTFSAFRTAKFIQLAIPRRRLELFLGGGNDHASRRDRGRLFPSIAKSIGVADSGPDSQTQELPSK